jgi:GTPase-associated adaptor domain/Calcineurin-like phosphoesterase
MSITFVHLSDIHFGQEKPDDTIFYNNDVKEQLINDASSEIKALGIKATGIIVTGDIAFSGQIEQYNIAGEWLDRLAAAVGCDKTSVLLVPGNHDINRKEISAGCNMMLNAILENGHDQLHAFLEKEVDRETLYKRFDGYRPFAEAYNCPLDTTGGIACDRSYAIDVNRKLRFIGLNSAIICCEKDVKGQLLLGIRQYLFPINAGEELVVMSHHPLHWLKDSEQAGLYLRNRARVFFSGHEHISSVTVETNDEGLQLMKLTAGATVPAKGEGVYSYTYNIITFGLIPESDSMQINITPRIWSHSKTAFELDKTTFGKSPPQVDLVCPNFKNTAVNPSKVQKAEESTSIGNKVEFSTSHTSNTSDKGESMSVDIPLLLLKFFRDLTPTQRLEVLIRLNSLPKDWSGHLTHIMERKVFDSLIQNNRAGELEEAIRNINGKY